MTKEEIYENLEKEVSFTLINDGKEEYLTGLLHKSRNLEEHKNYIYLSYNGGSTKGFDNGKDSKYEKSFALYDSQEYKITNAIEIKSIKLIKSQTNKINNTYQLI